MSSRRPSRLVAMLALLPILTLALGACGDDDDPAVTGDSGSPTTAGESDGADDAAVGGVEGSTVTLVARDISISPESITVPSGTELTFVYENQGELPHNLKIEGPDDFSAKTEIKGGPVTQELAVTLPAPGDYAYVCEVHPGQMDGALTAT